MLYYIHTYIGDPGPQGNRGQKGDYLYVALRYVCNVIVIGDKGDTGDTGNRGPRGFVGKM